MSRGRLPLEMPRRVAQCTRNYTFVHTGSVRFESKGGTIMHLYVADRVWHKSTCQIDVQILSVSCYRVEITGNPLIPWANFSFRHAFC